MKDKLSRLDEEAIRSLRPARTLFQPQFRKALLSMAVSLGFYLQ
jgi:hypothetical protein